MKQLSRNQLLAGAIVLGYFLVLTRYAWVVPFAPDDPMNMYMYWRDGFWGVLKHCLQFWSSSYRPMAGLFYLPLHAAFGLNPFPYRVVCQLFLMANLYLVFAIARALSGKWEAAAIAALVYAYHADITPAVSTSQIYDILCCFFYLLGLLLFMRDWPWWALVCYICAFDSKEMAVTWPAAVLLYELLFREKRRYAFIAATGVLAAIYTAGKVFGPDSLVNQQAYRPDYTSTRLAETSINYFNKLIYSQHPRSVLTPIVFWIGLLAVALWMRSRPMIFGAIAFAVTIGPLYVVPPREAFALYLPFAFLCIWAGAIRPSFPLLIGLAFLLGIIGEWKRDVPWGSLEPTSHTIAELRQNLPTLPKGSKVLFRNAPFGDNWDMYFLAKLFYNDRSLQFAISGGEHPDARGDFESGWDREYDYDGRHFIRKQP